VGTEDSQRGFFEKRKLLFADPPDAAALAGYGSAALAAGELDDALEAFVKAGDKDGLQRLLEAARAAGDTFSFEAAARALGAHVMNAEWVAIAETALAAGRLWFAYRAFEKADSQEGLERTRHAMHAANIHP